MLPSICGVPKAWNSISTSRSCPWVSPKIRHGSEAFTSVDCAATILHAAVPRMARASEGSEVKSFFSKSPGFHSVSSTSSVSSAISLINFFAFWKICMARFCTDCMTLSGLQRERWSRILCTALPDSEPMHTTLVRKYVATSTPHMEMISAEARVTCDLKRLDNLLDRLSEIAAKESRTRAELKEVLGRSSTPASLWESSLRGCHVPSGLGSLARSWMFFEFIFLKRTLPMAGS
mmetsp:Transcript_11997/g.34263  ORF Transcript_11997/g.34263 Transcript_11997/m.34263 type:complete len:234 (-) Transcript_11997:403-1104(-)